MNTSGRRRISQTPSKRHTLKRFTPRHTSDKAIATTSLNGECCDTAQHAPHESTIAPSVRRTNPNPRTVASSSAGSVTKSRHRHIPALAGLASEHDGRTNLVWVEPISDAAHHVQPVLVRDGLSHRAPVAVHLHTVVKIGARGHRVGLWAIEVHKSRTAFVLLHLISRRTWARRRERRRRRRRRRRGRSGRYWQK